MPSHISCFDHGTGTGAPYTPTGPYANEPSCMKCFDRGSGTGAPYTRTGPLANVPSHISRSEHCLIHLITGTSSTNNVHEVAPHV